MSFERGAPRIRHTWCPQDERGVDHYTLSQYLRAAMGEEWGTWWMGELDRLMECSGLPGQDSCTILVQQICRYDAAALVELLYPVLPELFLMPRRHPMGEGELNAVARCAQLGALASLETLLELGADPNGLDCTTGWNRMPDLNGLLTQDVSEWTRCVTPLDCAQETGEEECCFLLEQYGAETAEAYMLLAPEAAV